VSGAATKARGEEGPFGTLAAPAAVVIGLNCITGLQTARLLSRRGVSIVGITDDPSHPCCRTNTVRCVVTSALSGPELLATLARLAPRVPGAVLLPCTDASVHTLSRPHVDLPAFRMALPDAEVVDTLMAKDAFERHATAIGVDVPRSRTVTSLSELLLAADDLRFPCVVKPALKTPAWEAAGAKVRWFDEVHQFVAEGQGLLRISPILVVQEWIPGDDSSLYSCNCYVSPAGIPLASFVARKLRQWPPYLGTSSAGEAVADESIRELALKVLLSLPFRGFGYVEIKRDTASGRDVVIEANVGRPTGRSAIAEAGGVELLATMYCDLIGAPLPAGRSQQEGRPITWVHLVADMQSALHYRRIGALTIKDWLLSLRGPRTFADLDLADPLPFIGLLTRRLRSVFRRSPTPGTMEPGAPRVSADGG
jgi:D-aspartate ligase